MSDKPLLDVDLDSTINSLPPKSVIASALWFVDFFNQAILNPGQIKENENKILRHYGNNSYSLFLLEGYQSESHTFKEKAWENMDILPIAEQVGYTIVERASTGITALQTDTNIVRYLADGNLNSFLEIQSLGDTVDIDKSLRRARIISMMNASERRYQADGKKLESEGDWQEFFETIYNFFDPQKTHGSVKEETEWVRTYALYYSAVWNYSEIDFADKPEGNDNIETKFRGLIGFINSLPSNESEKLFLRMYKLDKSTEMKISSEGGTYLPTREVIRSAENLYSFNLTK